MGLAVLDFIAVLWNGPEHAYDPSESLFCRVPEASLYFSAILLLNGSFFEYISSNPRFEQVPA